MHSEECIHEDFCLKVHTCHCLIVVVQNIEIIALVCCILLQRPWLKMLNIDYFFILLDNLKHDIWVKHERRIEVNNDHEIEIWKYINSGFIIWCNSLFKKEPSWMNVILQQKRPLPKFSTVCTVYKKWLATSNCNCGLRTTVKAEETIPYFSYRSYCFYQYNCNNTISSVTVFMTMLKTQPFRDHLGCTSKDIQVEVM